MKVCFGCYMIKLVFRVIFWRVGYFLFCDCILYYVLDDGVIIGGDGKCIKGFGSGGVFGFIMFNDVC